MRKTDNYHSPECFLIQVEVATVLASSTIGADINIKNPSWNTDGDYGLE